MLPLLVLFATPLLFPQISLTTDTPPIPKDVPASVAQEFEPDLSACTDLPVKATAGAILSLTVDAGGVPHGVSTTSSSGVPCLDEAAVSAVKQYRFIPAMVAGKPAPSTLYLAVQFARPRKHEFSMMTHPQEKHEDNKSDGIQMPLLIKQKEPRYPHRWFGEKRSSVVLVNMVVDKRGIPTKIKIAKSGGEEFDQAAMDAVSEYRFKPGMKNGEPIEVEMNVEVNFQL